MRVSRIWLGLLCPQAIAYTPPRDTAGPLTSRIDGPAIVSEAGGTFTVTVVIESSAAVSGTLRVAGIDGWIFSPAAVTRFAIAAGASVSREFRVTPPRDVYNAHYPIHAFAAFEYQGKKLTAHPVLVVETKFPATPRVTAKVAWNAFDLAKDSALAVWRLPAERFVVQVFGKPAVVMPAGWQGSAEGNKSSLQLGQHTDRGGFRECIAIHPPYADGQVGTAFLEFPVALPSGQKIRLKFANAVRDGGGDGVTFRVRAASWEAPPGTAGDIVFERHSDSKVWLDGEADLSKWAGRKIRLQLESHPGPKNNTAFDQSYWGEPLLLAGEPERPAALSAARKLGAAGVISLGRRGVLDGRVTIGHLTFDGFSIRVLGDALEDWRSPSGLREWKDESTGDHVRIRHRFRAFDLMAELWGDGPAVRAHFWLENQPKPAPWQVAYIEDASLGKWQAKAQRLYQGVGNVMDRPAAFRLGFDGHRLASSFIGAEFENGASIVQAVDLPPTDMEFDPGRDIWTLHGAHNTTFTIIAAKNVWEGVKVWRGMSGMKAAGGVKKLAGRFVFDLWGGKFAETSTQLKHAAAYGLRDSVVVWHNWQRWGYDVRLPDIFPPNPQRGTEAELAELARTAHAGGMLFAPHDNYIDFYPDADGFTYDDISFRKNGLPVPAWFNKGAKAQSYRWRTDRMMPYLERNLKLIRDAFAPSAYFIDVWSSAGPYDSWTRDGGFIDRVTTRDTWGKAFAWIRDYLGNDAPQISESGHDQLIGWLDGAQANHLRVDTPPTGEMGWTVWNNRCKDSERIPWLDAAYHDRFILHGAGYENRYAGGLDPKQHGMYSDDYISTEVMTGHPAMVKHAFNRDVVRKYYLLGPLMRALALQTIESVEFAEGDPHRQHIRWSEGGEVWVNRSAARWQVDGHLLPQYGFYARIGAFDAAIEERGGVTVEWSRGGGEMYFNSRGSTVAFDKVKTNGAFRMTAKNDGLWFTPLPDSQAFQIWVSLSLQRMSGRVEKVDESGALSAPHNPVIQNGEMIMQMEPGVFGYVVR